MSTSPKKPEIIVTRKKSFEMKRQLRDTAKSMKKISQMTKILRAPIYENNPESYNETKKEKMKTKKDKNSKKEHQKKESLKKIKYVQYVNKNKMVDGEYPFPIEKESLKLEKKTDDEDYFMEKPKRRRRRRVIAINQVTENTRLNLAGCKRVMENVEKDPPKSLKQPKMSSSPVNLEDQRSHPSPPQPEHPEPDSSTTEHLTAHTDSLTDEDLIEILTCESPVWWEELPDAYHGESTCTKSSRGKKVNTITKESKTLHVNENMIMDPKFIQKRSKLENLLGNIKSKLNKTDTNSEITESKSKISLNHNNHVEIKKIEKTKEKNAKIKTFDTNNKVDNTKIKTNDTIKEYDRKCKENIKLETNIVRKMTSESSENDDFLYNNDLLNDFANIEIPIEDDDLIIIEEEDNETRVHCEANVNKINDLTVEDRELNDDHDLMHLKQGLEDSDEELREIPAFVIAKTVKTYLNSQKLNKKPTVSTKPPEINKVNEQNSQNHYNMTISSIEKESSSPISIKSSTISDATSLSSVYNLDTISDTNITFIDEVGDRNSTNDERVEVLEEIVDGLGDENSTNEERVEVIEELAETTKEEIKSGDSKEISTEDSTNTFWRLKEAYKVLCNEQIKSLDGNEKPSISDKPELNNEYKDNHVSVQLKIYDDLTEKQENYIVTQNNDRNTQEINENEKKDDQINNKIDEEIIVQTKSDYQNNVHIKANNEKTKMNSFYKKCKNSTKRRIKNLPTRMILEEEKLGTKVIEKKLNISILNNKKIKSNAKTTKSYQKNTNIDKNTLNTKTTINDQNTSKTSNITSKNIEKSESKLVSNGAAKYCMKCSSIFDTEDCGYCLKKLDILLK